MGAGAIGALGARLGGAAAGSGGMTPFINMLAQQTGGQAAQGAMGGAMGMLFANSQDRRQVRQAEKLQNLQVVGQKHMIDYGYEKQLQMWKDTNYGAQVEQMKMAGLNPGLLYGMSGGGGTTTGQTTGNVQGQTAPHGGGEPIAMAQTMMGLGLQRAQMQNIQADTKLKEATATKTAGIDTKVGETQVASLTQGITNQEATEKLTRMHTAWQEIQNSIARQTIVDAMKTIENNVKIQEQEIQKLKLENKLNERQQNDQVLLMKYQAAGAALHNTQTQAQTENIREDTKVKIQQVTTMIKQLIMQGTNLASEVGLRQRIGEQVVGMYDELPNPIQDVLNKLGIFVNPLGKGGHTPVKGFQPGGQR